MLFIRLIPALLTLGLVAAAIVYAGSHSWSDSQTQWAITGIIGASVIIDLSVSRWWSRASAGRAAPRRHEPSR
jgi:hypothetical protein